ncbi:MAG: class I SAM-dependent rRNA methyltransferase [Pedosphaera sp.]|nr:class I SAM-dependent rRNA methyltransferase [Pedosphaera sp.]
MSAIDLNSSTPGNRLRLRVAATAETILRSGHPWLFSDKIRDQNREGQLGELAVVFDRKDRFLAIGLFDPESPIRVRVLHAGKPETIDRNWWERRLKQTVERRHGLFDPLTTGYRWINGESDGWPGLVLDRYAATLVLKLYSAAWLPRLEEILTLIDNQMRIERIVLRLSRNIQELARQRFCRMDGQVISGAPLSAPVVFEESGLKIEADVLRGQKTGFFLDQRENRRLVESLARGRDVLNVFSFSGAFSLYAARGGARSVHDLDISSHALAAAQRNFRLNQLDTAVGNCRHQTEKADAFEWLQTSTSRLFDLIILDPPSLAKRDSERTGALQAYEKLVCNGIRLLRPRGILVAASCSARVTAVEFFQIVRSGAQRSERKHVELRTTHHPPDHPSTFKEAEYLKCIFIEF